jgi:hypothetical protein
MAGDLKPLPNLSQARRSKAAGAIYAQESPPKESLTIHFARVTLPTGNERERSGSRGVKNPLEQRQRR